MRLLTGLDETGGGPACPALLSLLSFGLPVCIIALAGYEATHQWEGHEHVTITGRELANPSQFLQKGAHASDRLRIAMDCFDWQLSSGVHLHLDV